MQPRYELHINGEVIIGPLKQLQNMGINSIYPYEIYVYYRANTTASSGNLKLNIHDMREAKRMRERGYSYADIAKKFCVRPTTISRVIQELINPQTV